MSINFERLQLCAILQNFNEGMNNLTRVHLNEIEKYSLGLSNKTLTQLKLENLVVINSSGFKLIHYLVEPRPLDCLGEELLIEYFLYKNDTNITKFETMLEEIDKEIRKPEQLLIDNNKRIDQMAMNIMKHKSWHELSLFGDRLPIKDDQFYQRRNHYRGWWPLVACSKTMYTRLFGLKKVIMV